MSWKDVLAIVADVARDEPALALAQVLADHFDARLSAALVTPLPDEPLAYEPTAVAGVWAELLARARAQGAAERVKLEARLRQQSRPAEIRVAEALSRDLGRVAAVHARYADIAVLARPLEGPIGEIREELIEGILFHSGRPLILAPPHYTPGPIGRRVIVAWDASREATRALSDAEPLLARAEEVSIVTVDARPRTFGHGEAPGANIAAHLQRRGHKVSVRNLESQGKSAALMILAEAEASGADLIVMGGYAHSRFREFVFGGVTRDALHAAKAPLLMAH